MLKYRYLRGVLILAVLIFHAGDIFSTPRIAAKYGKTCIACHQNPSGKGMRNEYGATLVSVLDLPVSEDGGLNDPFNYKQVSLNNLSVGGEYRASAFYRDSDDYSQILSMQGNLYFNFRPITKVQFYYNKQLYDKDEIFGIAHILPWNGYIKIGTFVPNYGITFDDHNAFVRERLGFSKSIPNGAPGFVPGLWDSGISVGLYPGPFHFDFGIYNGSPSHIDVDKEKAIAGRLSFWKSINSTNINLGASFYRNELFGSKGKMYGFFGMLGVKEFALLAEADWVSYESNSLNEYKDLVLTVDGSWFVRKGVDLKLRYDLFKPDNLSPWKEWKAVTGGVNVFPYFLLETSLNYRYNIVDGDDNFGIVDLQFHIFF
ncbi:hypothetical protein ACFL6G_03155 [candidate division KSB1 bacterium]